MNSPPTVRDLLREAGGRLPTLLAVSILVQVLGALVRLRERNQSCDNLSPDDLILGGAPPRALLADPSRDPRVRVTVGPQPVARVSGPQAASALFRELIAGTRDQAAIRLRQRLLGRRTRQRLDLDQALDEARALGLELMAERLESQELPEAATPAVDEDSLRQRLAAALYAGRYREVESRRCQLSRFLGDHAEADVDLAVARGWLAEQAELRAWRQDEARKTSLKLILTGAPLIFATFLTSLLGVVLLFSA